MEYTLRCQQCHKPISEGVYQFSVEHYGYSLCLDHQRWMEQSIATPQAKELYFALKERNIPVELEYFDGKKTIDIAIPGKLYIEMDGKQLLEDSEQVLTELLRSFHSAEEKIPTIRIPNTLAYNSYLFQKAVESLSEICIELKNTG